MPQVSSYTEIIKTRISPIVENLIQTEPLFDELNKEEAIAVLIPLVQKHFSPEEFDAMPDWDLTERIDGVLEGEVLIHLLSDWTPEQKAEFEELMPKRSQW